MINLRNHSWIGCLIIGILLQIPILNLFIFYYFVEENRKEKAQKQSAFKYWIYRK